MLGAPWQIVIPETLIDPIIIWYHKILSHVGMTRLYNTISVHFNHLSLNHRIENIIQSCDICQRTKLPGPGYGLLPPHEALITPWFEVAVDLIRPLNITINARIFMLQALTCIDTVNNLAEVIQIENKTSTHISMLFENNWLARYPCSSCCIHDNREFWAKGNPLTFPLVLREKLRKFLWQILIGLRELSQTDDFSLGRILPEMTNI